MIWASRSYDQWLDGTCVVLVLSAQFPNSLSRILQKQSNLLLWAVRSLWTRITIQSTVQEHLIFSRARKHKVFSQLGCYGDTSFEVVGYGIQGHLSSFCTNCVQFSNSSRFPVKILRHHVSCYISDLQAPSNSYRHIASKVWGHMIFCRGGGVGVHNQSVFGRVGTNII